MAKGQSSSIIHGAKHGNPGGLRLAPSSAHQAGGASNLSCTEQAGSLQHTISWNSKGCGAADGFTFTVFQEYGAQVKFEIVTIIPLINRKCVFYYCHCPGFVRREALSVITSQIGAARRRDCEICRYHTRKWLSRAVSPPGS